MLQTQIFTQKNTNWLRFYSEFLNKNLVGGVSGLDITDMIQNLITFSERGVFLFYKIAQIFCWLKKGPPKMDNIHAVLTTFQIYKSWYQLGLGSQKGPKKSQLCWKSHPYNEMPSKFLNSKS